VESRRLVVHQPRGTGYEDSELAPDQAGLDAAFELLAAASGSTLAVEVGDRSLLVGADHDRFIATAQLAEDAFYELVGDPAAGGLVDFPVGGQASDHPARHIVTREDARAVASEFLATGTVDVGTGRWERAVALDAGTVIGGRLHRTPLLSSDTLGRAFGGRAYLKAELFQKTGSFKPRGMLAKLALLTAEEKARGVISISAGNAAQGLAWACAQAFVDCLVVMWQSASAAKIAATRAYGAEVDVAAANPVEAFERVHELAQDTGRTFVHPYDDPAVIAGHSTLGREIVEDLPEVDVVVVPVGGGGLVAGVALGTPAKRVIAVEPEGSAALHLALRAGEPVPVVPDTIADALTAPRAGEHPLRICMELGVESVLVTEDEIRAGFRFLYERAKLAAEPGAAVGVAALLAGKIDRIKGKTVAVVVSGGNVAAETASDILKESRPPDDLPQHL
jgi:threonine dehydratase